jgi:hypothetical protein
MTFLQNNRQRKDKRTTAKNITEHSTGDDLLSLIIYLIATISYFIKKNFSNTATVIIIIFYALYCFYGRYFRKSSHTEMIDGMEVPKLVDNYDLSLD